MIQQVPFLFSRLKKKKKKREETPVVDPEVADISNLKAGQVLRGYVVSTNKSGIIVG